MGLIKEFKEFAVKGNVADMAVGIVVGAAFGKIVSSFVADIITPPLGILVGGVDFSSLKLPLSAGENGAAPVTLNYGVFLQNIFDFVIVAFALFLFIKLINRMKRSAEAEAPAPEKTTKDQQLLGEIRDLLKAQAKNN